MRSGSQTEVVMRQMSQEEIPQVLHQTSGLTIDVERSLKIHLLFVVACSLDLNALLMSEPFFREQTSNWLPPVEASESIGLDLAIYCSKH